MLRAKSFKLGVDRDVAEDVQELLLASVVVLAPDAPQVILTAATNSGGSCRLRGTWDFLAG